MIGSGSQRGTATGTGTGRATLSPNAIRSIRVGSVASAVGNGSHISNDSPSNAAMTMTINAHSTAQQRKWSAQFDLAGADSHAAHSAQSPTQQQQQPQSPQQEADLQLAETPSPPQLIPLPQTAIDIVDAAAQAQVEAATPSPLLADRESGSDEALAIPVAAIGSSAARYLVAAAPILAN